MRDDPAIMAWQLANEPRPAGSEAVGTPNLPAFYAWVRATARLIKSLDPQPSRLDRQRGAEGLPRERGLRDRRSMRFPRSTISPPTSGRRIGAGSIPPTLPGTWPRCETLVRDYVGQHLELAARIGKPLVFEEFGFPREGGSFDPAAATTYKDRYYRLIYSMVLDNARSGGPAAGSNFWAWNGEGRAAHVDHHFHPGDTAWLGDSAARAAGLVRRVRQRREHRRR